MEAEDFTELYGKEQTLLMPTFLRDLPKSQFKETSKWF